MMASIIWNFIRNWYYLAAIIGQVLFIMVLLEVFLTLPLLGSLPIVVLWSILIFILLLPIGAVIIGIIAIGCRSTILSKMGLWRKYPKRANAQLSKWAIIPFIIAVITTYGLSGIYTAFPELTARVGMRARIHNSLNTELPNSITNLSLVNSVSARHVDYPSSLIHFDAAPEEITQWLQAENHCGRPPGGQLEDVNSWWANLPNWWQPNTAEQYVEYRCDFLDYGEIRIDQTNDERWIVYIYAYDI